MKRERGEERDYWEGREREWVEREREWRKERATEKERDKETGNPCSTMSIPIKVLRLLYKTAL